MKPRNETAVSECLLLGLTDDLALRSLIFSLFLSMYLVTILGNLLITLAVSSDPYLHTTMYFFLCSLSFNDVFFTTCIIPKMLVNIQTQDQSITYTGCLSQVCFVILFTVLENSLLAVMSYDRYVAICHPLRYAVFRKPCLCVLMELVSLSTSTVDSLLHMLLLLQLSFCTDLEIPHFFCELAQVIKLACSEIVINNILIYISVDIFGGVPLSGIIFSYSHIVSSVLRMPSSQGKTAVASVMYTMVPQMLNPFIYSLRSRAMKEALRKLIGRTASQL
ncbi:Olfactory receptor 7G1 [Sciurus carolinensis]|uniref:Olfactory receptor n=1 Tax=Sciurus carolinensis TaxID=30640 RepID=A0AA41T139_SCICA|nr:Olfactory receptor 7G1 [Sciurus carolinensis]